MTRKLIFVFLMAMLPMTTALLSCNDSDDREVTDGDGLDNTDGDENSDPSPGDYDPNTNCDDVCLSDQGFYCDQDSQTCQMLSCTPCDPSMPAYYCGDDAACVALSDDINDGDYCLRSCALSSECEDGYTCKLGKCRPLATCPLSTAYSLPGGACEFGGLHPDKTCTPGDSCIGAENADEPCDSQEHCQNWAGTFSDLTPEIVYCANGNCGFAMCVVPCDLDGTCPEIPGYDVPIYPGEMAGGCYCGPEPLVAPVGTAPMGSICNTQVEDQLPLCDPQYTCLGRSDSESSCSETADCDSDIYGPNAYCSRIGQCSYSYCAAFCEDGRCAEGSNYVPNANQCQCTIAPYALGIGAAELGEMCNPGDAAVLQDCLAELHCRSYNDHMSTACSGIEDCPADDWGPNRYCSDKGYCAYSICAEPCIDGECAVIGTEPLKNTPPALCLCAPAPYGGEGPLN